MQPKSLNLTDGTERGYFPQLDAIRAIAVIAVVFGHIEWIDSLAISAGYYCQTLGVRLFFVLSGFLITRNLLLDQQRDSEDVTRASILMKFYIKRAIRILPPYYLIITLGILFAIPPYQDLASWCYTFTINFVFAFRFQWAGPVAPFWTLAIEEQFYLIWPFIILFLSREDFCKLSFACLLLSPAYRIICYYMGIAIEGGFLMPAVVDSLAAGSILAYWRELKQGERWMPFIFYFYATVVVVFIVASLLDVLHLLRSGLEPSVFLPLLVWMVYGALSRFTGPIGKVLEARPLIYIGKISYAIYLVHLTLVFVLVENLEKHQLPVTSFELFLIVLLLSVGVGAVIRYGIELPGAKFRGVLVRSLSSHSIR